MVADVSSREYGGRRVGGDLGTLVERHLELVHRIARRIFRDVGAYIELDDLISFGSAGLLEAASRYDPERGVTFATFAYYRIRGAIYDGVRKMGALPPNRDRRALAAQCTDDYLERLSKQPQRASRAADRTRAVRAARELVERIRAVQIVYIAAMADSPEPLELVDSPAHRSDQLVLQKQRNDRLKCAIDRLPARERQLIRRTYFDGIALGKAGAELGLSASWTSRLHARAVDRLRDLLVDIDPRV